MVFEEKAKNGMSPSIIRENFEYAKKRKLEIGEDKVFDFSIGNPYVNPPEIVKNVLNKLVNDENSLATHGYTSNAGDNKTREVIANYLNKTYDVKISPEYIFMTTGAASAITISLTGILSDDDEVIIFSPYFSEYVHYIHGSRGKVVICKSEDETLYPDINELKNKINKKTRAIIINSPNNPTGVIYTEEVLNKINEVLRYKEKEYGSIIYTISDEPYREIVYDNKTTPYTAKFVKNTISCYSFSKSLSIPGERIGYIAIDDTVEYKKEVFMSICYSAKILGYVCAPSIFQKLIAEVMGEVSDIKYYDDNRKNIYKFLKELGFTVIYPDGAFYLFIKSPDTNANAFCEKAKKYEIILVRGDEFGNDKYVRLAYCVDKNIIESSKEAFIKLSKEYFN